MQPRDVLDCPRVPLNDQGVNDLVVGRPYVINPRPVPVTAFEGLVSLAPNERRKLTFELPGAYAGWVLWHTLSAFTLNEAGTEIASWIDPWPRDAAALSQVDLQVGNVYHAGDRISIADGMHHWSTLAGDAAHPFYWPAPVWVPRGSAISIDVFNASPTTRVALAFNLHAVLILAGAAADRARARVKGAWFAAELDRLRANPTYDLTAQRRRVGVARFLGLRGANNDPDPVTAAAGTVAAPVAVAGDRQFSIGNYGGGLLLGLYASQRATDETIVDTRLTRPLFVSLRDETNPGEWLSNGYVLLRHVAGVRNTEPAAFPTPYAVYEQNVITVQLLNLGEEVETSLSALMLQRQRPPLPEVTA